jgi:cytidyltransferase-like protein
MQRSGSVDAACMPQQVVVTGPFDDLRSRDLRFLEEASKLGPLTVLLWSDQTVVSFAERPPKFPLAERVYLINAVRYVTRAIPVQPEHADVLPPFDKFQPQVWVDRPGTANDRRETFCRDHGLEYSVLGDEQMNGFPAPSAGLASTGRKKVVVTGCYDWLHSGHIRFFEEVSRYGDLYVIVGHDANIRLLKGEGHPLFPQEERRYLTGSIRYVTQSLISSGEGWLDADPEIQRLKPGIYAVNEDGDRGGKREYCARHGIEYLVLKRMPAPGLPRRSSTDLRGF